MGKKKGRSPTTRAVVNRNVRAAIRPNLRLPLKRLKLTDLTPMVVPSVVSSVFHQAKPRIQSTKKARPGGRTRAAPAGRPGLFDPDKWKFPVVAGMSKPAKKNRTWFDLCEARSTRKEVLHALGKTGRGRGGSGPHKFTPESKERC